MKRIAIVGGGIAGLAAAYELTLQERLGAAVEFVLFEAKSRLGGIVETVRRDGFVIECGPDSWVTEKPWARQLAIELGLESELVPSNDERRKTYIAGSHALTAMPDGMRMMVPTQWDSVLNSQLFSEQAKLAYRREPELAEQLKTNALDVGDGNRDESVRDFVVRHFGEEVANTIAAPLLAGVFGGDIAKLSVRAVMPTFIALERQYGSLIVGLQQQMGTGKSTAPIFTSLKNGLGALITEMESVIPERSLQRIVTVESIEHREKIWRVHAIDDGYPHSIEARFDTVLVATPAAATAKLLHSVDSRIGELLPQQSSSAIVVALGFAAEQALSMGIPPGFGFLVPQHKHVEDRLADEPGDDAAQQALLACTFLNQKFPHTAPDGAILLRAFFGGALVPTLLKHDDTTLIRLARRQLERYLGRLPEPSIRLVRRWPNSLPLYEIGHGARMAELDARIAKLPHLRLIGNAYRGVGLPDLIQSGRTAAREIAAS
ncbi:MAG TPA: protoporphyrinogen oxidase [Acidobacteriaceae bacterium]|nr:protoporphyrinogen oxidase [Acidobacteriaceae bacterium]